METDIIKCSSVSLEKFSFNKLHMAFFKDVEELSLVSGSFELKQQVHVTGQHGPVTSVSISCGFDYRILWRTYFDSSNRLLNFVIMCHVTQTTQLL